MKILFVGESWQGSTARSLKEALHRKAISHDLVITEVCDDHFFSKFRGILLRGINRLLRSAYRQELANAILAKCSDDRPDALVVFKGSEIDLETLKRAKEMGILTVNVFPDYSPHAYGPILKAAMGAYDIVISTKPFHPANWSSTYGYSNRCYFIPHGYDPVVHLEPTPPANFQFDVGLVATYRPEYFELIRDLADVLGKQPVRMFIAGPGWESHKDRLPSTWSFIGPVTGQDYKRWLRSAKIMIAPVNRRVVINGKKQPGDEDTTRSYELAAAHCFFIHQRTGYIRKVYDEQNEVPMFNDAAELGANIQEYLAKPEKRKAMAAAAHSKIVPAHSLDSRASEMIALISNNLLPRRESTGPS